MGCRASVGSSDYCLNGSGLLGSGFWIEFDAKCVLWCSHSPVKIVRVHAACGPWGEGLGRSSD